MSEFDTPTIVIGSKAAKARVTRTDSDVNGKLCVETRGGRALVADV